MRTSFPKLSLPQPHCDQWEWQLQAACHAMPASMFFPSSDLRRPDRLRLERAAKLVCDRCPVLRQCRDHALDTSEAHGIWGGLTAGERHGLITSTRPVPEISVDDRMR